MIILTLISVNILFLLVYAICIRLKISRLSLMYLLLGFFVPFIGGLCMLFCEFGYIPFYKNDKKASSKNKKVLLDNPPYSISSLTRETILNAVKNEPENLIAILKKGLESDDTEVVHISASSLMKIQNKFEERVNGSAERYYNLPENKEYLEDYISALSEYINTGILIGEIKAEYIKKLDELKNKSKRFMADSL